MSSYLRLFSRFIWRDLLKDWGRTGLTVFGIALGVSVLLAISLANYTALAKFKETVDLVAGKANLEILATSARGIDQSVLEQVTWLWQLNGKFTPVIKENVVLPAVGLADRSGTQEDLLQFLGVDMLADADFARFHSQSPNSGQFLGIFSPKAVLIGQRLADKHHLAIGSDLVLLINDKLKTFKIAGILSGEGLGGVYSGNCIVADLRTAQDALAMPGLISQIEIIVPPKELKYVKEKLERDLPATYSIVRPASRGEQIEKITKSFEYNLMALTLIALMVGMFLIYNTMTISVIRRRPEIGTLRALGAHRRLILSLFSGENLLLGTIGTTLGVLLGLAFASTALHAIAGTYQHFYFQDPLEAIVVNPSTIAISFLLGIGLTFASGFAPVLEATSVQPAIASRPASYQFKIASQSNVLALWAAGFFLIGSITCWQSPVADFPLFGYIAALSFILGFAFLMPIVLRVLLPLIALILAPVIQPEGKIAAHSLRGALSRTAVATASLMIGIAMMVSLAIMVASFRQTVGIWIDQTLKADLWLESSARAGGSQNARLEPAIAELIKSVPGVGRSRSFC